MKLLYTKMSCILNTLSHTASSKLNEMKQSSEFWKAWVEKDASHFRKYASLQFAQHIILSEGAKCEKIRKRIHAVDVEVKNLKGMQAGRRALKTEPSDA